MTEASITAQQQDDKAKEIGTTLRGQAEERDHCECAQEGHSETGEALRCHKKKCDSPGASSNDTEGKALTRLAKLTEIVNKCVSLHNAS